MRVAVLSGGRSSEHEISLESGASVAAGLREAGHEVSPVLLERDGRWTHEGSEVELRAGGGLLGADVAFPVLHGPFGEDGTVQGLLECLDVPYAGPGVLAAAISIDKLTFKRLLVFHGIPQVDFCEAGEEGWRERVAAMGLPVWVKPARLGSSVGISKVTSPERALDEAVELARRHDPRVIVEANGGGREVECSVIGNEEPRTSPPGEIVAHADWYDFEAKYSEGGMDLVVPARIGDEANARVRELAARVFKAIDGSGLARCDFFVLDDGEVLVNELNTIPGFTSTSVFAKLFEADGIAYQELCDLLVHYALERHEAQREFRF
ncbi:MAG TPA: D-alanine--D-alanine ligase family protein [Solirubrobacterales bacterium]|jgi:D-alanine-D-alanine ligase|nr:D-alanine--D-alanine ligase family protein [Solirubrobacterales bacterium]